MTFYLKPPNGKVILRVIEEGVRSRLKVLMSIHASKPLDDHGVNIEHVFENSPLDRVSHFVLRLSCLFSPEFQTFFIQSETKFFQERLSTYDHSDVRKMLLILQKHLNAMKPLVGSPESSSLFLATEHMCTEMLKGKTVKHAFSEQHSDSCREHVILVHFQHCSSLVRKREVDIKKGMCHVYCGTWRKLLVCFFQTLLTHGVKHLGNSSMAQEIVHDTRLKSIVSRTLTMFRKQYSVQGGNSVDVPRIKADMVDMESELFPPCALNILQSLRLKHRVGHHARIQLTLFLKGIGMDVNDAIEFWKEEYTKTSCCSEKETTCLHSWKKDSSRYVYNIQHLYGLQGGRKSYNSRPCSALQSGVAKCEEGCPFEKMNSKDLIKVLPRAVRESFGPDGSTSDTSIGKIMELASQGKAKEACEACFVAHFAASKAGPVNEDSLHHRMRDHAYNDGSSKGMLESCENKSAKAAGGPECSGKRFKSGHSSPTVVASKMTADKAGPLKVEESQRKDAQDFTLHYPTQYYLALKSKMVS